ncbi:hypothetical protein, partial [Pseudomonas aeruginosa]|uniref:hypothetical protein n=1 Tax=Pseudomonas aeruginosa TaxID=287 RepID=UPI001C657E7D
TYSLDVSFVLLNKTGQILAEQNSFARFTGSSLSRQHQLPTSLTFQFEGLPAGTYVLKADYTDEIGGKSAAISLPFQIVAAE